MLCWHQLRAPHARPLLLPANQLRAGSTAYREQKLLYKVGFSSPACSMLYLPIALESTARTVLVGFADGVIRALLLCSDAWKVIATFRPHSGTAFKHAGDAGLLRKVILHERSTK